MTQTAVARQAGLSRSFYAQLEHAGQAISVDRAFAIASVLGVEMAELFTGFPRSRTPAPTNKTHTVRRPQDSAPSRRRPTAPERHARRNWEPDQYAN